MHSSSPASMYFVSTSATVRTSSTASDSQQIRQVEQEVGRPIGVLADMQGPKLRVGTFAAGPVMLDAGSPFRLDLTDKPGDATRAHLPHPEIFAALQAGRQSACSTTARSVCA